MSPEAFGWLARVHGHLAVLGLALLLHPIITLWRRGRAARWTVRTAELAAAMLACPFMLGWWIYPTYRTEVRGSLPAPVARTFESKEHLAVYAVVLAIGGALALRAGSGSPAGRRVAHALLLCAWICGAGAGVLGLYVAGSAQPGW